MARRKAESTFSKGPIRYASYGRCSTDDQKHKDFSTVDVQMVINQEYVAEHGGIVAERYLDEGRTGTNLKRPGWLALLAGARERKFDRVVITYMSRLGRGDAYTVAEWQLNEIGIAVEMVKESFADDIGGYIGKNMTRFMDGFYPQQVSVWTKTKQAAMVLEGYFTGGNVPFGYQSVPVVGEVCLGRNGKEPPKRLVPNPDTAPFVQEAYRVFAATGSYNRAVDYLRTVTPRKWAIPSVRHILENPVYRGICRFGKNLNETAHEAIITQEMWLAVENARTHRPPRSPKQNMKDTRPYYLRHRVNCVHCAARMTPAGHYGANREKTSYYECLSAHRKLTEGCTSPRVNATALHASLLTELTRCAKHPTRLAGYIREAVKKLPDTSAITHKYREAKKRLLEVERRIAQVTSAIEQGGGSIRSLVDRLSLLERERLSIEEEKCRLEGEHASQSASRPDEKVIAAWWSNLIESWEDMPEEDREWMMGTLVEQVDIHTKESGTCKIRISGQVPRSSVVTTVAMGAGVRLELTTFGL